MAQTIRSVVIEVRPESAELLRTRVVAFREREEQVVPPDREYDRLKRAVPLLHFMAVTVFTDQHLDPILVIEANFDGPPGPFWAQLEAAIHVDLRSWLRCCKVPRDGTGALFQGIVASGSALPIAPYLEARTVPPAVGHVGNRGLDRPTIEGNAALFARVQEIIGTGVAFAGHDAQAIHRRLRAELRPRFPWLDSPAAPRIPAAENAGDWLRLIGFVALALGVIALPAIILFVLLPAWLVVLASVVASVLLARQLDRIGDPDAPMRPPPSFAIQGGVALLGLVGVLPVILGFLVQLRRLERRDAAQDAPPIDAEAMREMARREDHVVQNHMGSVVLIKPGILRAVLVRAALRALGLVLRVLPGARAGFLGSMRTIHFAHWAILDQGGRLLFFSNFDGTWESYLDDFIEKAHGGLTLAWTCGVGFPPTRYAVFDGASQGRRFKAWARRSMAPSLFWFSAFPDWTVDDIERHARVAEGLRAPALDAGRARQWTRNL